MIELSGCIELGTITRCHGIRGQLVLRLNNLSHYEISESEPVFIEIDGLPVPFFISDYAERTVDTLVLAFEDIQKEEEAKDLVGCRIFLPTPRVKLPSDPQLQTDHLLGFTVIDSKHGVLGILENILDYEKNPLLRIIADRKEILLPLHNDFIHEIDEANKSIRVNIPDGLLDVFD